MSQFTARILPGTGFEVDIDPDGAGDLPANLSAVRLRLRNPTTTKMTAAGMNAVIARVNTYYSAAKLTSIIRAKGGASPVVEIDQRGAKLDMLMADVASWVTNLTSDLAGTTNLTAGDY